MSRLQLPPRAPAPSWSSVASPDDQLLAEWLRYFGAMLLLGALVGATLAAGWGLWRLPGAEVWSIVVDTEQVLPSRQLGVVAETLFRAEGTYRRAMDELSMEGPPDELYRIVSLKAVPESRLLIVTARAHDGYTASLAADAMARSLARSFDQAGYPNFDVLGLPQPAPVSSSISVPVLTLLGAVVGLLLGLAVAVLWYRGRRQVLAMRRAAVLATPARIVTVPGRGRWLGLFRPRPPQLTLASRAVAAEALSSLSAPRLRAPGAHPKRVAQLAEHLGFSPENEGDPVLVCDASTRESDLELEVASTPTPFTMLWIG